MDTYVKLAIETLRCPEERRMSLRDEEETALFALDGEDGSNRGPWDVVPEVAASFQEIAEKAAGYGICSAAIGVCVTGPDSTLGPTWLPDGILMLQTNWQAAKSREYSEGPDVYMRLWGTEGAWERYRFPSSRHGAVDFMRDLLYALYANVTKPCRLRTIGTDYASFHWLPCGFERDEHSDACFAMADALESGVSYEDVFAGYGDVR